MKRAAVIFTAVTALLFADGLYMVLANYHPGDANTFFGNQNWNLSDGEVTLISAAFVGVATLIMWGLVIRRGAGSRAGRRAADQPGTGRPQQPCSRSASRT